jgi:O-acetyl-ADP-ribose deacetylase
MRSLTLLLLTVIAWGSSQLLGVADALLADEVWFAGVHILLVEGDITAQAADGIVNAANPGLMGGGGVDGAIHRAAGAILLEEGKKILRLRGPLAPGEAASTSAGRLTARRVIHSVGPIWRGGRDGEPALLARAYTSVLQIARAEGLRSLALPSISTGAYGYPVDEAARIALGAVRGSLESGRGSLAELRFVLHDADTLTAYQAALQETFGPD